eukprot:4373531-Amphidinium_carterae.1
MQQALPIKQPATTNPKAVCGKCTCPFHTSTYQSSGSYEFESKLGCVGRTVRSAQSGQRPSG